MEPTLFGIGKAQWELINSFSNWLAAIGTIAAVVVSLHLANRIARRTAKLSVGHRLMIRQGIKEKGQEFVVFRVVNSGERPVRITHIGWRVGLWNKRYAQQMYETLLSNKMPTDLTHGQEAQWYVPLEDREGTWLRDFARKMLMPGWRISCFTLRAQAFSSLGDVFEAKVEHSLSSKLREACKRLSESKNEG